MRQDKIISAREWALHFSPRFNNGLLGTLFGDGKTAIRGGYRITYDVLFYNILSVNGSNFPRVVTPQALNQFDVFPKPFACQRSGDVDPLANFVNTPSDAQNPMGQNFSLTIQRQLRSDYVLEFGYAGSRGTYGINQLQANPLTLTPGQIATVQGAKDANRLAIHNNREERRLAVSSAVRFSTLIATTAQSTYHSGFVSLTKRLVKGLQFTLCLHFQQEHQ